MKNIFAMTFLILSGCILSPRTRNSRFSLDITKMQKADFYKDTWIYRHPTKKVTDYHEFWVDPIPVYVNTAAKVLPVNRPVFDDLGESFREQIINSIKNQYTLVKNPGKNTLKMDISIVDIKPIVTLIRPDGNEAVVTDTTLKGTKIEIDCYDAGTGESIFALSTLYKGEAYTTYEDIALIPKLEEAFTEWRVYFRKRFDDAMKKNP